MNHQQESSSSSTNKSVSFATTATMRLALHINNYTDEEIDASFYSDVDYYAFKQDAKRTAKMIEMKQSIDEINMSRRGVESMTSDALKVKSRCRRHARRAVMFEQELLMEEEMSSWSGEHSPQQYVQEKIAAVYTNVTRESVAMAYLTGLSDEAVVIDESSTKNETVDDDIENNTKATSCPTQVLNMVLTTDPKNIRIQHHRMSLTNHAA